jgi:hypothetical protein
MSEIPHYHFFYNPEELQKNDGPSMLDNDFVSNNQLPTPQKWKIFLCDSFMLHDEAL